jgi:hypothetical protein
MDMDIEWTWNGENAVRLWRKWISRFTVHRIGSSEYCRIWICRDQILTKRHSNKSLSVLDKKSNKPSKWERSELARQFWDSGIIDTRSNHPQTSEKERAMIRIGSRHHKDAWLTVSPPVAPHPNTIYFIYAALSALSHKYIHIYIPGREEDTQNHRSLAISIALSQIPNFLLPSPHIYTGITYHDLTSARTIGVYLRYRYFTGKIPVLVLTGDIKIPSTGTEDRRFI